MFEAQTYRGLERRVTTPSPAFAILSVLGVAAIVFATLCPIGLRPHLASANQERIGAYFVLGFLFAMTFRRHWKLVAFTVALIAVGLEAGQLLVPGRDARVADAVVKALGGLLGSGAGNLVFPLKRLLTRRAPQSVALAVAARPAADIASRR